MICHQRFRARVACAMTLVSAFFIGGCGTPWPYIGAAAGATLVGGQAPTQELQSVYYLGIFDPLEQVPPSVYRVTIHGQGSLISGVKFASGWVPASVADGLNEKIGYDSKGALQSGGAAAPSGDASSGSAAEHSTPPLKAVVTASTTSSADGVTSTASSSVERSTAAATAAQAPGARRDNTGQILELGRRMILFGPEGFMEAPREHRLVIVMGSDPSKFFDAIGKGMLAVANLSRDDASSKASQEIFRSYLRAHEEHARLAAAKEMLGDTP